MNIKVGKESIRLKQLLRGIGSGRSINIAQLFSIVFLLF